MFKLEIDHELALSLVEQRMAPTYFDVVQENKDYLAQWLAWPEKAKNADFFAQFIQRSLHDYADGKSLTCMILFKEQLVGNISFNKISPDLKKVEIGYWLAKSFQGQGIMQRAVNQFVKLAFIEMQMEKVEIFVATKNEPSRKVCERLGFQLEGIITRAENLNGRIVDHAIYAQSKTAWLQKNALTAE